MALQLLSIRTFLKRHRKKFYITAGVVGGGYVLYKLYDAYRVFTDMERTLASEQGNDDELVKAQMQAHFENIQRIADSITLPHTMNYLSTRIAEELDVTQLTDRLMKGKGQHNTLTPSEKLELWDGLKIQSFTRMVLSLWAMTMLHLYIRVQVNILGRHLYIDTASGLGSSHLQEDVDLLDRNDEQKFLASADFLSHYGLAALISNMQAATKEVMNSKQLRDIFSTMAIHETIRHILDVFMSRGTTHQWVDYLMPEDSKSLKRDVTKFDQLMVETRGVLESAEFGSVIEISLKIGVDQLTGDIGVQSGSALASGLPLAKLLPRVSQMGLILLEEPIKNRYIQNLQNAQDVELFFTLLYANMPLL